MKPPKPIDGENLKLLSSIGELHECEYIEDANAFLKAGALLVGVATVKPDADSGPFRLLLGWPLERGEPPWDGL